jgi:hypothetical protein
VAVGQLVRLVKAEQRLALGGSSACGGGGLQFLFQRPILPYGATAEAAAAAAAAGGRTAAAAAAAARSAAAAASTDAHAAMVVRALMLREHAGGHPGGGGGCGGSGPGKRMQLQLDTRAGLQPMSPQAPSPEPSPEPARAHTGWSPEPKSLANRQLPAHGSGSVVNLVAVAEL